MVPVTLGVEDQIFITQSFDPTSHFETAITDVLALYERLTGSALVLDE